MGDAKKLTIFFLFLVAALKTQAKTTKSTTPTFQKRPLYNYLQVFILHISTAAVTKHWGQGSGLGRGQLPLP